MNLTALSRQVLNALLQSRRTALEVLFPAVRAKLLRLLFVKPLRPYYGRELAVASGLALHTVQDELRKLTAIGLLVSWSNGYNRFYKPRRAHPLYRNLAPLVRLSEKLPRTKDSALRRPSVGPHPVRQRKSKPRRLPPERPMSMHLFEKKT